METYLVRSPDWGTVTTFVLGAVTWRDGTVGTKGVVSAATSLVGSTANDAVGSDFNGGVTVLSKPIKLSPTLIPTNRSMMSSNPFSHQ